MAASDKVRAVVTDRPSWTADTTILIRVGTDVAIKDFHVHQSKLTKHSQFFNAALTKPWKEATEKLVALPEETPDIFSLFVDFVYTGRLFVVLLPEPASDPLTDYEYETLAATWIMADRLQSVTLKDAVVDCLCSRPSSPTTMHQFIYPASSSTAKIRLVLVDIAVHKYRKGVLEVVARAPEWVDWFADVAVALDRLRSDTGSAKPAIKGGKEEWCRHYHEHGEEACWRTMFSH